MQKGLLVPHLGEQAILADMVKLRQQGKSFGDIADWLNQSEIKTKNGSAKWDRPTVFKIIKRSN
jgi:hypothetical protein